MSDTAIAAPPSRGRGDTSGYSLVEVLAASVLLAGVLLAIMTMFVAGGQQINSGKLMSKATSIAQDVLEEFRRLSYRQSYQILDDTLGSDANTRLVWSSATWAEGDTPPANLDYQDLLKEWKRRVEGGPIDLAEPPDADVPTAERHSGLPQGEMTITVRGLAELGDDPDEETFEDASLIQVMVTVRWVERKRERSVVFETLKI